MIPTQIEYRRPETVEQAFTDLARPGGVPIAGGQALVAAMKRRDARPRRVVDLQDLGLDEIVLEDDLLRIGATATWATVARHPAVRSEFPAVLDMASVQGDRQVRNMATVGGALAMGDPRSDVWASAQALRARIHVVGPGGEREVGAALLYERPFETTLERDELIVAISLPRPRAGEGSAYRSVRHPASHYPRVGVAANLELDPTAISSARLGLTAASQTPCRLERLEDMLAGRKSCDGLRADLAEALTGLDVAGDHSTDPDYLLHLVVVTVEEAVRVAFGRAGERRAG